MNEYGFRPELIIELACDQPSRKLNLQYAFIRLANYLIVKNVLSKSFTATKDKDMCFLLGVQKRSPKRTFSQEFTDNVFYD